MRRFVFDSTMPTPRLVRQIADRAQIATQRSWKRPYGVGLLVAGADPAGARLFYNCPSGNFYDYKAFAIGARSQVRPLRQLQRRRVWLPGVAGVWCDASGGCLEKCNAGPWAAGSGHSLRWGVHPCSWCARGARQHGMRNPGLAAAR